MLGRMRVWPLDLYEAFGTDGLITAPGLVEVGRIIEEADGTFGSILVQVCF
jgi:hypothetical protein